MRKPRRRRTAQRPRAPVRSWCTRCKQCEASARQASCSGSIANRRVLRLSVPGRLARRPLRGCGTPVRSGSAHRRGPESKYAAAAETTPAGSGRKLSRRPRTLGNARRSCSTPAPQHPGAPAAERLPGPDGASRQEFPGESSWSVFARGSPGNLLDSGQEVMLVPLTPITAVTGYARTRGDAPRAVICPGRALHDLSSLILRAPAPPLAHGHAVGLPGRQDPGGHIRPAPAARPP